MMMKTKDIHIRDPFVLPLEHQRKYFLYGTTEMNSKLSGGFYTYVSEDLALWDGPIQVFLPESGFWGNNDFWAPEVYYYKNRFYMFASFNSNKRNRGTHILVSETPLGPFKPWVKNASTPKEWGCLDGTLYIDEEKNPWMIFCQEWLQVADGRICAVRLSRDLKIPLAEPYCLFSASDAQWTVSTSTRFFSGVEKKCYITDGPFIKKMENGELLMIWSSFSDDGYAIGTARSEDGNILGPWKHDPKPLNCNDGGHGMFFHTFEGSLVMTMHTPNHYPRERCKFYSVQIKDGKSLRITDEQKD